MSSELSEFGHCCKNSKKQRKVKKNEKVETKVIDNESVKQEKWLPCTLLYSFIQVWANRMFSSQVRVFKNLSKSSQIKSVKSNLTWLDLDLRHFFDLTCPPLLSFVFVSYQKISIAIHRKCDSIRGKAEEKSFLFIQTCLCFHSATYHTHSSMSSFDFFPIWYSKWHHSLCLYFSQGFLLIFWCYSI